MDLEKYFSAKGIRGRVQTCIASDTARTLKRFCEQEPEFAQAVEQSGKTFQQCLDHVAEGAGASISDFKVYSKAAAFYFPGATIDFRMVIDLIGDAKVPAKTALPKPTLSVSFDSLLDF